MEDSGCDPRIEVRRRIVAPWGSSSSGGRRDPARAVSQYRAALALGGSRPLPELFAAAGFRFDLSRRTLEPLVAEVREALAGLPERGAARGRGRPGAFSREPRPPT